MSLSSLFLLLLLVPGGEETEDDAFLQKEIERVQKEIARLRALDFVPAEFRKKPAKLDDERNAREVWQKAFEHFQPLEDEELRESFFTDDRLQTLPGGSSGETLKAWIEINSGVVDLIDDGCRRGRLQIVDPDRLGRPGGPGSEPYPATKALGVVRLISCRVALFLSRSDQRSAMAEAERLVRYGDIWSSDRSGSFIAVLLDGWCFDATLAAFEAITSNPEANALAKVKNPVGKFFLIDFGFLDEPGVETIFRHETRRRLLLLELALRIHVIEHGALPDSLAALAEREILPSVPTDPYSDKPFGYSKEKRILWSVGPDGDTTETENFYAFDGSPRRWVRVLPRFASSK